MGWVYHFLVTIAMLKTPKTTTMSWYTHHNSLPHLEQLLFINKFSFSNNFALHNSTFFLAQNVSDFQAYKEPMLHIS